MDFGAHLYNKLTPVFKRQKNTLIKAIIYAIGDFFNVFDADFKTLVAQASILTADGIWLDFWGFLFRVKRYMVESDSRFRNRLMTTLVSGTSTKKALLNFIQMYALPYEALTITEYLGDTRISDDYSTYDFIQDRMLNAFILKIEYTPSLLGSKVFVTDNSSLDNDTVLNDMDLQPFSVSIIETILRENKIAGVKLIVKAN